MVLLSSKENRKGMLQVRIRGTPIFQMSSTHDVSDVGRVDFRRMGRRGRASVISLHDGNIRDGS